LQTIGVVLWENKLRKRIPAKLKRANINEHVSVAEMKLLPNCTHTSVITAAP
jgi:hypothetical protein